MRQIPDPRVVIAFVGGIGFGVLYGLMQGAETDVMLFGGLLGAAMGLPFGVGWAERARQKIERKERTD